MKGSKIQLKKMSSLMYLGSYKTKDNRSFTIIIENKEQDGYFEGYCKEFKKIKTAKTLKGCKEAIEHNLKFWNY